MGPHRGEPRKGLDLVDVNGSLRGPFPAFIRRPHIAKHLLEAGAAVRFDSSLEPRLLELAITTVGARWKSEFEFWAHGQLALAAGIEQSVLDSLVDGAEPHFSNDDEAKVYRFAEELATNGRVSQPTYDAATQELGHDAVTDLTLTIGYYTLISFTLNTIEAPLPPGVTPAWQS